MHHICCHMSDNKWNTFYFKFLLCLYCVIALCIQSSSTINFPILPIKLVAIILELREKCSVTLVENKTENFNTLKKFIKLHVFFAGSTCLQNILHTSFPDLNMHSVDFHLNVIFSGVQIIFIFSTSWGTHFTQENKFVVFIVVENVSSLKSI